MLFSCTKIAKPPTADAAAGLLEIAGSYRARGDDRRGYSIEACADAAIEEGLATAEELARLRVELLALAADERTFLTMPRVVQAWARRPV